MGVGSGVAFSGKVLDGSKHPTLMCPGDEGRHKLGCLRGIFAESTGIDDRVQWICVYIGDGRKGPLDTDGPGLLCGRLPKVFCCFDAS